MNLLFALVILLTLVWGQICVPTKPESLLIVFGQAAILAAIAPAFAALQVWIFRARHAARPAKQRSKLFRAMAISHSIVWSVLSIAIIAWVRWFDLAALIPATLPLVDELVLISPAILSLIASWAIFIFCLPSNTIASDKTRASLFWIWLRMQVLMLVAPLLAAFFVSDCILLFVNTSIPESSQTTIWILAGFAIVAGLLLYPRLMTLVWSTRKIKNADLQARFRKLFVEAGVGPRAVRVWQTNNTIVNAAAIGIIPGTEVIVVSDLLLEKFDDSEVDAIVLHEIGHVRHLHCIKRIAMVIVPLICLAADQSSGIGLHLWISQSEWLFKVFGSTAQFLPAVAFVIYLWLITKTTFRKMEFEADGFATKALFRNGESRAIHFALEKMAVIYPQLARRKSGLHPSVRQRLAHVLEVESQLVGQRTSDTSVHSPHPIPAQKSISLDPIAAK